MMLPEHIVQLRDWMDEDEYIDRPQLNDFDLQLIQEEIEIAYKSKCETLIKTWKNGKVTEHQGIIEDIDVRLMIITLKSTNATVKIPVNEVMSL